MSANVAKSVNCVHNRFEHEFGLQYTCFADLLRDSWGQKHLGRNIKPRFVSTTGLSWAPLSRLTPNMIAGIGP